LKISQSNINQNKQELKKLNKEQKTLISSKQKEIQTINKIYDERIKLTQNDNLVRLDGEKEKLQESINQAINHKDQKLKEARDHLAQTQILLNKEEKLIKDVHTDKLSKVKEDNKNFLQDTSERSQVVATDSQQRLKETLSDLNFQTNQAIQSSRHQSKMEINNIQHHNNNKIIAAKQTEQNTIRELDKKFVQDKTALSKNNQERLIELNDKHLVEEQQRTQIHKDKMTLSKKYNKDLILQERNNFQIRYDKMVKEHSGVMSRLKDTLTKEINNFKLKHSQKLATAQLKQEDPFYKTSVIGPTITEDKEAYYFAIKTPEHEKDQYTISGHKREIKLSFARKHFDDTRSMDESHSTRRTESLTKTFGVKDIVNPRNLTQSYNDGILTFRINKA
jgi:HSP20 family molecular chaperone IbpA